MEGCAALDTAAPWLAPYGAIRHRLVAAQRGGMPAADALNAAAAAQAAIALAAGTLRFVDASELPPHEAYESFIARTARVPTRDNLHDLLNGLVWLRFPAIKRRLNELQAQAIARGGIGPTRGALRDALTLFDENGAWLQAPPALAEALRQRDWQRLFVAQRAAWADARLTLAGHALLEKLARPRKPITAHVWCLPPDADAQASLLALLDPRRLTGIPRLPLPVLGVPGWWPANEAPAFYDDPAVFRPPPAPRS